MKIPESCSPLFDKIKELEPSIVNKNGELKLSIAISTSIKIFFNKVKKIFTRKKYVVTPMGEKFLKYLENIMLGQEEKNKECFFSSQFEELINKIAILYNVDRVIACCILYQEIQEV